MNSWRVSTVAALFVATVAASSVHAGPTDAEFPLDVDLGDRVDPVRPGEDLVYELEVENFTSSDAPDVVVVDHLPPGTSFVVAHRQPDWAKVPALVDGDRVRFELGAVPPCDQSGTARCRDLWVVLRIDPDVPEGTLLTNRVTVESSDDSLPPNEATTVTTAASAAIRSVRLVVGRPGRDRASLDADLARSGLPTPLEPPTPTFDASAGLALSLGVPGQPPLFEIDVPAGGLECSQPESPLRRVRCKLGDKRAWKPLGVRRLDVTLPGYLAAQRNNAYLRLALSRQTIAADTGPELELVLVAGGKTYTDRVSLVPDGAGRTLRYTRSQGDS